MTGDALNDVGAPMNKIVASLSASLFLIASISAAPAQPYPGKPIKFIVPFAAGGPADTMARLTAQTLSEGLNQTIVIDNRPGPDVWEHGFVGGRAGRLLQSRLRSGPAVRPDCTGCG